MNPIQDLKDQIREGSGRPVDRNPDGQGIESQERVGDYSKKSNQLNTTML
jgi:hypothetical protein